MYLSKRIEDRTPTASPRFFWRRIAEQIDKGTIVGCRRVYRELTEHEAHRDFVRDFVMVRRKQLCLPSNKDVDRAVGEIGLYLFSHDRYDPYESWKFEQGGDPWVIAHAKVENGIVVTQESKLHPEAKKPLVPDVCKAIDVDFVDTLGMFDRLNLTF